MIANPAGHLGKDVFLVNGPNLDASVFNSYKILDFLTVTTVHLASIFVSAKRDLGMLKFSDG